MLLDRRTVCQTGWTQYFDCENMLIFFIQLTEKIIPAFEKAHRPGYQALIMVDNSQGHSAYAEDALLVSRMNVRPGGKQARMQNGWFVHNGQKITQPLVFPSDYPNFPNEPKG